MGPLQPGHNPSSSSRSGGVLDWSWRWGVGVTLVWSLESCVVGVADLLPLLPPPYFLPRILPPTALPAAQGHVVFSHKIIFQSYLGQLLFLGSLQRGCVILMIQLESLVSTCISGFDSQLPQHPGLFFKSAYCESSMDSDKCNKSFLHCPETIQKGSITLTNFPMRLHCSQPLSLPPSSGSH